MKKNFKIFNHLIFKLAMFISLTYTGNQAVAQINSLPFENCNCAYGLDIRYFRIIHYHKIIGHSDWNEKKEIQRTCSTAEFTAELKVVADGSESSLIEIEGEGDECGIIPNLKLNILDENFNEVLNTLPEKYGSAELVYHNGRKYTFKYKHPSIVPDEGMPFKELYIQIVNSHTSFNYGSIIVKCFRPPIAMIHGLWSDMSAFSKMKEELISSGNYQDYQIHPYNYQSTNDASFSSNSDVLPNAIKQCFSALLEEDISCGKVDIVCHSMGGILTRNYLKYPLYSVNNDIRRVITCNTPHAGSQMANFLLDPTQYGTQIASLLNFNGMNCDGGAVSDLRVGQPTINSVAYGSINGDAKVHSIQTFGDIGPIVFGFSPINMSVTGLAIGMIVKSCGNAFLNDVFDSPEHDIIVAAESQRGGLSGTHISGIYQQVHMESVANSEVINKVKDLLDEPAYLQTDFYFSDSYSGFTLNYDLDFPCLPTPPSSRQNDLRDVASIDIISPASGTYVNAGDTVTVTYSSMLLDTVMATIPFRIDSVIVVANSSVAGTLDLPVPLSAYGLVPFILTGLDENKRIVAIDSIMINVGTSSVLDSIFMTPDEFYMNKEDTLGFIIFGKFSDNIVRNIGFDENLEYNFLNGTVSKTVTNQLVMNGLESDTLIVNLQNVLSDTIIINKVGNNFEPGCSLVTNTYNEGIGSIRYALLCAMPGDTIFFDATVAGDTIFLDTIPVLIDNDIALINTNNQIVTIMSDSDYIFNIFGGTDVWLENIKIVSSQNGSSCINNFGSLTLKNVEISTASTGFSKIENNHPGTIQLMGSNQFK